MAVKKMNQFNTASDGAYIYAEAADGSQVKIAKADLFRVLLQDRGSCKDANEATIPGVYRVDANTQNVIYSSFGVILTLISGPYYVQVYFADNRIQVRKTGDRGNIWTEWKSITLT